LLTITVFLALTLAGSIILGFVIIRQIIRPVESLAKTAQEITAGDIGRRSVISSNDELGELSDAFNLMTSRLAETITSLKNEIVEKKKAEEKIRQAYKEWQRTFDSISQPVSILDSEYRIIKANKALTELSSKSFDELIGRKCYEVIHCANEPVSGCPHTQTMKTGKTSTEEIFEPLLNKHLRLTTSPVIDDSGAFSGSVHIAEDITERKIAEEKLNAAIKTAIEEKAKLDAVIAGIGDGISIQDTDFRVLYQNDMHKGFVGSHAGEYCYKAYENRDEVCEGCPVDRAFKTGIVHTEQRSMTGDGEIKFYDITASPIRDSAGKIIAGVEVVRDITERKRAENRIIMSLREKEVLLKEIHHRVKNNMQVISSLLNLQSRQLSDKRHAEMFNESRNRIISMALVHEKLYNAKDLANVDIKDYIHSLVSGLFTFYDISTTKVSPVLSIENISLSIDTAIPCGLIINELVSNTLKYAFPQQNTGELRIALSKGPAVADDHNYILTIGDNGIGIGGELDIRKAKTLGLQLVTNLVEHQLQGSLHL
ncbi:MAG: histidine kinase dimerization/phosphoacceptor domain -containing protein, partial [Nitrospirota bacterium]